MTTRTLLKWVQAGQLPAEHLETALTLADARPDRQQTLRWLDPVLLTAAVLCACSSVIFFLAYNWDAMGRLQKFSVAQAAVLVALLPVLKYPLQHWIAQSGLFAAGLLLGALLALIGQTYQTGADTYELFLVWAVLLVPWVWLARSKALAGLVWVLLNVAMVLALLTYTQFSMDLRCALWLGLNLLCWLPVGRLAWLNKGLFWTVAHGLLLVSWLAIATGWALLSIWDVAASWLGSLVWALLVMCVLLLYLWRQRQWLPIVLVIISAVIWVQAVSFRLLPGSWALPLAQAVFSLLIGLLVYLWFNKKAPVGGSHEA